tara:strand:- start:261 stop:788 length:528 start_codon:yes stop_codon:yes gene_type:complete
MRVKAIDNRVNFTGVTAKRLRKQTEDEPMNTQAETISLLQIKNGAKLVSAVYLEGNTNQHYTFKDVVGVNPQEDDLIVVQSKDGVAVVRVVRTDVNPMSLKFPLGQLKHVISTVNTQAVEAVEASERKACYALQQSEVEAKLSRLQEQLGVSAFGSALKALGGPDIDDAEVLIDE